MLNPVHVRLVRALHELAQRHVVVAVQFRCVQALGAPFDVGVEVVRLLQVQVELAVLGVGGNELSVHRAVDFAQHGFHLGEQVVGRVAAQLLDARLVQAQTVAQFLGRSAQCGVDVALRQAMHRERMDQPQRHRLVRRARERLLHAPFQRLAAIHHRLDVRHGAERRVAGQVSPVAVVGDETRVVIGHTGIQHPLHGVGERAQSLALFGSRHALESVDVLRMDGEQAHVLVHAFVQALVELPERRQIVAYLRLLLGGLAQQPFGHHELHVALGDDDLREAILHATQGVGGESEAFVVEDGLLHAGHEAQAQGLCMPRRFRAGSSSPG